MAGKYYVIGTDAPHWPLTMEPGTLAEAQRAVDWQVRGTAQRSEFAICTYDPAKGAFLEVGTGAEYRLTDRGPYTEAAWARFQSSLPVAA